MSKYDIITKVVRHSKSRNIALTITIEDAWNLFLKQNRKCSISGRYLNFENAEGIKQKQTASLDRIDSSKGYTIDNVQWVHKDFNKAKMAMHTKDFIKICIEVAEYQNKL